MWHWMTFLKNESMDHVFLTVLVAGSTTFVAVPLVYLACFNSKDTCSALPITGLFWLQDACFWLKWATVSLRASAAEDATSSPSG